MDGRQHRILAGACAAAESLATGAPWWQTLTAIPVAMAFSSGWVSPDGDQSWLSWAPGGHRGLTHWWLLPVLAAAVAHRADLGDVGWLVWAAIIGWSSHLLGDFIFGERPAGIPLAPWWWHIGLELNSGGRIEKLTTAPGSAMLVWWAAGHPGSVMLADTVTAVARSRT
jgi:membrane-bound metal-dependent hydrolase YbcI (DUF457 family)